MAKKRRKDKDLILEANRITYSLRSTFFYRKLKELHFFEVVADIDQLTKQSRNYSWEERKFWKITHNAWDAISERGIKPLRVFAHPKVLVEHPHLISYYRNVAAIPLKGVQYLAFNVTPYEHRKRTEITYASAMQLAELLNTHISAIIESTQRIDIEQVKSLMFSSAGCTIDGSWRNRIGEEAENMVKSYITRYCFDHSLVASPIDKSNSPLPLDPNVDYVSSVFDYRGFKLANKRSVLFGSEPDVSIIGEDGGPLCAIEVKGGTDPAGALERLGAIKKSFQHAMSQNKKVHTALVVSCITKEMHKRLKRDRSIKDIFNLTLIVNDMDEREKFLEKIGEFLQVGKDQ